MDITSCLNPSSRLSASLTRLFAVAAGLSVANVYYAQPLLDILSRDFSVSPAAIGGVITATQLGCAAALLFVVPLGDRLNRRFLMQIQFAGLLAALLVVGLAQSAFMLLAGMLATGLAGTAMTQGLIAYAASAAAPGEQGRVVGTTQGGVFIGLLLARVFSGGISDIAGWRAVYILPALLMAVTAIPLFRRLPDVPQPAEKLSYPQLIASVFTLLLREKVLQIRGILAFLMFASFSIFWSALVLPLSAPPYQLSHTLTGAFGLAGASGALIAARAGKWADQGYAGRTSAYALIIMLLSWWPLSMPGHSLTALIIGIILLDAGGQALHVTNQSMIFHARSDAPARLTGAYMLFYATGSGLGAISATMTYSAAGWTGICLLGAGVSGTALLFWWFTRHIIR
ncbi:MFS transporter [Morganella psychrotolerans]|uniref:MFS transporter n=1 Tax=Morganella psychrotolerans TaxID=368603 RepID=UPI0039B090D6